MELFFKSDVTNFRCKLFGYDEASKYFGTVSGSKNKHGTLSFKTSVKTEIDTVTAHRLIDGTCAVAVNDELIPTLSSFETVCLLQSVRHAKMFFSHKNWCLRVSMQDNLARLLNDLTVSVNSHDRTISIDLLPFNEDGSPKHVLPSFKVVKCKLNHGVEDTFLVDDYYRLISYTSDPLFIKVENINGETVEMSVKRFSKPFDFKELV